MCWRMHVKWRCTYEHASPCLNASPSERNPGPARPSPDRRLLRHQSVQQPQRRRLVPRPALLPVGLLQALHSFAVLHPLLRLQRRQAGCWRRRLILLLLPWWRRWQAARACQQLHLLVAVPLPQPGLLARQQSLLAGYCAAGSRGQRARDRHCALQRLHLQPAYLLPLLAPLDDARTQCRQPERWQQLMLPVPGTQLRHWTCTLQQWASRQQWRMTRSHSQGAPALLETTFVLAVHA